MTYGRMGVWTYERSHLHTSPRVSEFDKLAALDPARAVLGAGKR